MENIIMVISMVITSVATVVIAISAITSYLLASKIQSGGEEFREQITDFYKAIIISNLMDTEYYGEPEKFKKAINQFYDVYVEYRNTSIA